MKACRRSEISFVDDSLEPNDGKSMGVVVQPRPHRYVDLVCQLVDLLVNTAEHSRQRRHEAAPRGVELAGGDCIEARVAAQECRDLQQAKRGDLTSSGF